ncbi:NAD(P)-dependent dehydrogenase (short-subunit alcohol dehydrogenase family) [Olsenella profusa DSM 13989]|uniref:Oxidoreductase, short chain dehydrogenase/reductase family protein n=2 Tax=Olsenella profusa TaxID=138595 RepID=U2TVZ0_9ACTN|nr:hypothetical protein HMPREF1316_2071 [Olsenella profusa F0195]MDP9859855.1 NAD(P)-dependent dehydrogenase (short-subunit alcohol dehydrogenase family) [Olsenella profusa DSM 13989]
MIAQNMTVVVTGAASGIGQATCAQLSQLFSCADSQGHTCVVHAIDMRRDLDETAALCVASDGFRLVPHAGTDVSVDPLPAIDDVTTLINNAGIQEGDDRQVLTNNVMSVMRCTERYALHNPSIRSVVNLASTSAHTGAELGAYTASKGAVLSYTKWTAKQIAPRATCNSLSFGGVDTPLNDRVYEDATWAKIMRMTPLRKWLSAREAADWILFVALRNESMTAQDIVIDNGEMYNHTFVW